MPDELEFGLLGAVLATVVGDRTHNPKNSPLPRTGSRGES